MMRYVQLVSTIVVSIAIISSTPAFSAEPKFSTYPAKIYSKKTQMPDFSGAQRDFREYRTRIREGLKEGPNFAGAFSVIEIGCGMGCIWVFVGANRTGQVFLFPRNSDDNPSLELKYQLNSRLLIAQWFNYGKCMREYFVFDGDSFNLLEAKEMPASEYGFCLTNLEEADQ